MTTAWTDVDHAELFRRLDTHQADAVLLRRRLHAEPRVSGHEDDTVAALTAAIGLPYDVVPSGGAIVRIGDSDGPAIGLRAELDALPMAEASGAPWSATNGAMHACGHDVHMAAAYAVARTLHDERAPVPLVLVLQPREESLPSGAKDMVDAPELTAHDVRAFVGVHVQPRLPRGHFATSAGPVNAAADEFVIVVRGRPGHAAYPQLTADPVVAAADLIGSLQHLVSRQVDPMNPTVLTIGSVLGGSSPNVVSSSVRMLGTLRTFDEQDRARLGQAIRATATAVAGVHGCRADVELKSGEPVLVNDPELTLATTPWLERAGLRPAPPLRSCGSDDFSHYCARYPSLMAFVGVGSGDSNEPGLHHPAFLPPDQTVGEVARAMLAGYLGACSNLLGISTPDSPTEAMS